MDYKIAVCDDNEADIAYLEKMVRSWAEKTKNTIAFQSFPSAESFLFHYAEEKDYDILLLDVEMKAKSGVELAKEIRRENDAVQIIFVTGYSEYIAEGYEVSALNYLIKPVREEKFFDIMNRASVKLQKNEKALFLSLSGETVRIPVYEIRYLEVRQNYVMIHAREDYSVKRTLAEFERELDERFYRMGRSFMVNLSCIRKITKTSVFLSDGSVLPLPRGQYEPLNRAFISHT